MSALHRREETKKAITELQSIAQTFVELVSASSLLLNQVRLFSGVSIEDFGGASEPTAQARLDETLAAISASTVLLSALTTKPPGFDITIQDALTRIAKR